MWQGRMKEALSRAIVDNRHAQVFGASEGLNSIAGEKDLALELQGQGDMQHVKDAAA